MKKLIRNVIGASTAEVISAVAGFVQLPVFIHLISTGGFGMFVLFQGVVMVSQVVTDAGIGGAIAKRVSEKNAKDIVTTGVALRSVLLVVFALAVLIASPRLNNYFGSEIAIYLIPAVAAAMFARTSLQVVRGESKVAEAELIRSMTGILLLGIGTAALLVEPTVPNLIIAFIATEFIIGCAALTLIETSFGGLSMDATRSLFDYAKYNFIASVLNRASYSWADTLVLGYFVSPALVGAYEVAWRISKVIMMGTRAITETIFPEVSERSANGDLGYVEGIIPTAISGSLILVPPAVVGVSLLGEQMLGTLFGADTQIAYLPLIILAAGKLPGAVNAVISRVLLGLDQPRLVARSTAVFLVANIGLNVLLVASFGLVGAALATSSSLLVKLVMDYRYLSRYVTVGVDWKLIQLNVFATTGMGVILYMILTMFSVDTSGQILGAITIGAISFVLLFGVSSNRCRNYVQTFVQNT